MALNPTGLTSDLTAFFADPPITVVNDVVDLTASRASCAQEWADAMESYASAIVPASTTVASAAATLSTALAAAFANASAAAAFDTAFAAFATTVGSGMTGFTAVPPPLALGISATLATTNATHAAGASAFTTKIDTWMRTGTATPLPSGSPVNWS